ncbi:hypothetical protein Phi17:1_gp34 [Cellulophaga phage phi17:1]|uniref:Uncharacterized protein n=1 Tax=Cellulophaga phage phi17:1 TaxID=1327980 RepID=S0A0H8_9CAUD|nr:hypothetical protein Phi17:1_gp34 [Cellulophaga phage phi17:1]AGO48310.1 hypothetical protein Phi17:1_gp34 [Cellulophaga phage phi17:1]
MKEQERKQYNEAHASLIAYDKEQQELKEKNLKIVKDYVVSETYNDILEYIKYYGFTSQFSITEKKPKDVYIEDVSDDFDYLKNVWVDQYCDGVYFGDDFAGWVFIKITDIKYLKFHYSM